MNKNIWHAAWKWAERWRFIIICTFIVVLVLVLIDITDQGSQQKVVVIISAVASAVVTYLLLHGQKQDQDEQRKADREHEEKRLQEEERRSKGIQIYSNKIAAFSAFNESVWRHDFDSDDDARSVVETIRRELFSRVLLYLSVSEIVQITEEIRKAKESKTRDLPNTLACIVNVLNNNALKSLKQSVDFSDTEGMYNTVCAELWHAFADWENMFGSDTPDEYDVPQTPDQDREDSRNEKLLRKDIQAWHFCQLSSAQQNYLERGRDELSLLEYGEEWRTRLVQSVKKGDIVFLFRGNKKYSGVFKAKGWRVFKYETEDDKRYVTEYVSEGIDQVLGGDERIFITPEISDILKEYDFYESFRESTSTFCSNIVVEKISYIPAGVSNPNTTYRKTISRYYSGYAVKLLDEFTNADPNSKVLIDNLFENNQ